MPGPNAEAGPVLAIFKSVRNADSALNADGPHRILGSARWIVRVLRFLLWPSSRLLLLGLSRLGRSGLSPYYSPPDTRPSSHGGVEGGEPSDPPPTSEESAREPNSVSNVDATTELDALTFGACPLGLRASPAAFTNQLCGLPSFDSSGSLAPSLGGDRYEGS